MFIKRPLDASEGDETRLQGSKSPLPPRRAVWEGGVRDWSGSGAEEENRLPTLEQQVMRRTPLPSIKVMWELFWYVPS